MAEWENGLCETDCSTCLASWCCTCFTFGRAAERMKTFPDPDPEKLSNWNGPCAIMCAANCFSLGWIPIWLQRTEIRNRFGIEGNGCTDCLTACFCSCCAVSQMNGELKKRAESQFNDPSKGYQAAPAMTYAQPPQQGP